MAVLTTVTGMVKPGRSEDHIRLSTEAVKLFERMGAVNVRLMASLSTGEPPDAFVFSREFDTAEAWGRMNDELARDVEYHAFLARASGPDGPSTVTMTSTATEILPRDGRLRPGSIVEVHVSRPVPGRFEQGVEEADRILDLVERHGATNARYWRMAYAGAGSGLVMVSWEFHSLADAGRLTDLWHTDADMMAAAATQFGAGRSADPVWDGIYRVVPL